MLQELNEKISKIQDYSINLKNISKKEIYAMAKSKLCYPDSGKKSLNKSIDFDDLDLFDN